MEIARYLPGQDKSVLKKCLTYEPSPLNKEISFIAAGIIFTALAYKGSENTYLYTMGISSITYTGIIFEKDQQAKNPSWSLWAKSWFSNSKKDVVPFSIRLIHIIALGSLIGRGYRDSWVSPSVSKISFLIKGPLSILSSLLTLHAIIDASSLVAKGIIHLNTENATEEKTIATAIGVFVLSACLTYTVPSINPEMGLATLATTYFSAKNLAHSKKNHQVFPKIMLTGSLMSIGGVFGKQCRYICGPKDLQLPSTWASAIISTPPSLTAHLITTIMLYCSYQLTNMSSDERDDRTKKLYSHIENDEIMGIKDQLQGILLPEILRVQQVLGKEIPSYQPIVLANHTTQALPTGIQHRAAPYPNVRLPRMSPERGAYILLAPPNDLEAARANKEVLLSNLDTRKKEHETYKRILNEAIVAMHPVRN